MAKTIILEYPDNTPFERIRDDIDTVVRGSGGNITSPVVKADDETDDGAALIAHLKRQGREAEAGTGGTELESNQAIVTDGDVFTIETIDYTVSVVNNEILGFSAGV